MPVIKVNLGERSYNIHINETFKGLSETALASFKNAKALIVTDSNVEGLYSDLCIKEIKESGVIPYKFVFPAGEASKSLDTINDIYHFCKENRFERKDVIIALGGGVVGDIAGFAAATYLRGINFLQIPTTVIAQCDSSVGGKTGVDFEGAKNLVGAFYQPKLVYVNVDVLKTLPEREYFSGFGEIIKHAVIRDGSFFTYLEKNIEEIHARDNRILSKIVATNCRIKSEVVEADEREKNLRAILNFGHTIGHAAESLSGFSLLHGECVAVGMLGVCKIAVEIGQMKDKDCKRIRNLITGLKLPVSCKGLDAEKIYGQMMLDKKISDGKLNFILPERIGKVQSFNDIPEEIIMDSIRQLV